MALSRREKNIAKRGKRARREQFGPDIRLVRSNAASVQPGQPRGDASEHGSVLAGISADTDMRRHERPKRNTMSRRMMTSFNAGTSAAYDWRPGQSRDERWTPRREHRASQPRVSAVRVVDNGREYAPVIIRMGEFE